MKLRTFSPALYDEDTTLGAIRAELGDDFVARLQWGLGGRDIRVPGRETTLTPDCHIVKALGYDDAVKLCRAVPNECFYVPRGHKDVPSYDIVDREMRAGKTNLEIAIIAGISARRVRAIKQRLAEIALNPAPFIAAEQPRQAILTGG